jgi:PKD repeat protein
MGHISEEETEAPIPIHPVFISAYDTLVLTFTETNENGDYFDSVFYNPSGDGYVITVSTPDCQGVMQNKIFQQPDSLNVADFEICVLYDSCEAYFTYEPDFEDPFLVHFFDLSFGDYNLWYWEFGDGNNSYEQNPSHRYNASGEYDVCLTISDSTGSCMSTWCEVVFVYENDCEADFDWYVDNDNPLNVIFEDLSIGNIDQWFWDFGDDQFSEEQSPEHTYAESGEYLVYLFVTDTNGMCINSTEKWVIVDGLPECEANFIATLDTLNNTPFVYHFTNTSEGGYTNWVWDFGDGSFSEELNPVHTYEEGGSYQVCLDIFSEDSLSCNDFYCEMITTPEYYNFGGHAFLGDYPLNIEEDDSANTAIASLYRRIENKWELMDTREFWKFGYYWFVDKPEGEYLVRTDLLPESDAYAQYSPAYTPDVRFWENATSFILADDESFAVDVHLSQMADRQSGVGTISGRVIPGSTCFSEIDVSNELVYLLNASNQITDYTYTNEEGFFDFSALAYGVYQLKAEFTGKLSNKIDIILDANNTDQSGVVLEVNCDAYVGIEELNPGAGLFVKNVYPQPASQKLNIELSFIEDVYLNYTLFNVNGSAVLSVSKIKLEGNSHLTIDVESLNPGLYLLKISTTEGRLSITKKIIIN